jgi:DNA-binding transcriptional ArsR family regulator
VHTRKYQLEKRRKMLASMLAQSMLEEEIAEKLGVDQSTVSRDVRVLKEKSQRFIYDLAKSDLAYYYRQCLDTMHEAERMIWETYRNRDRYSEAERKERYQVARMVIDSVQGRFALFKDGPGLMQIKAIREKIEELNHSQIGSK